jgi:1-acyl-sn-glycerol-3-phosphate acyltransferase
MALATEHAPGQVDHHPTRGLFTPVIEPLRHRVDHELGEPLFRRDPAYIRRRLPGVTRFVNLFSPEVRGRENLPADGPVLVVGNHSCLFYMPDVWLVALEIIRRRGLERAAYALGYDALFGAPVVGPFLRRIGTIPAGGPQAEVALAQGALVLVYPGGDREACRPWTERNRIDFCGHRGFVRLALRAGVPVVPVVTHGSHDAVVVVSRGDRVARALGLDRLRIKVFPILMGPPFGLTSILAPPLPMPAAITVEFLPALDWSTYGPAAADDDDAVADCYEEVTTAMQSTLDRLRRDRPHPVLRGVSNLVGGGSLRVENPVP